MMMRYTVRWYDDAVYGMMVSLQFFVPSVWTQDIRKLNTGLSATAVKEQGCFTLSKTMGYIRPVLRLRCSGPGRPQTKIPFIH
jgi:hypothetical protein